MIVHRQGIVFCEIIFPIMKIMFPGIQYVASQKIKMVADNTIDRNQEA